MEMESFMEHSRIHRFQIDQLSLRSKLTGTFNNRIIGTIIFVQVIMGEKYDMLVRKMKLKW